MVYFVTQKKVTYRTEAGRTWNVIPATLWWLWTLNRFCYVWKMFWCSFRANPHSYGRLKYIYIIMLLSFCTAASSRTEQDLYYRKFFRKIPKKKFETFLEQPYFKVALLSIISINVLWHYVRYSVNCLLSLESLSSCVPTRRYYTAIIHHRTTTIRELGFNYSSIRVFCIQT